MVVLQLLALWCALSVVFTVSLGVIIGRGTAGATDRHYLIHRISPR